MIVSAALAVRTIVSSLFGPTASRKWSQPSWVRGPRGVHVHHREACSTLSFSERGHSPACCVVDLFIRGRWVETAQHDVLFDLAVQPAQVAGQHVAVRRLQRPLVLHVLSIVLRRSSCCSGSWSLACFRGALGAPAVCAAVRLVVALIACVTDTYGRGRWVLRRRAGVPYVRFAAFAICVRRRPAPACSLHCFCFFCCWSPGFAASAAWFVLPFDPASYDALTTSGVLSPFAGSLARCRLDSARPRVRVLPSTHSLESAVRSARVVPCPLPCPLVPTLRASLPGSFSVCPTSFFCPCRLRLLPSLMVRPARSRCLFSSVLRSCERPRVACAHCCLAGCAPTFRAVLLVFGSADAGPRRLLALVVFAPCLVSAYPVSCGCPGRVLVRFEASRFSCALVPPSAFSDSRGDRVSCSAVPPGPGFEVLFFEGCADLRCRARRGQDAELAWCQLRDRRHRDRWLSLSFVELLDPAELLICILGRARPRALLLLSTSCLSSSLRRASWFLIRPLWCSCSEPLIALALA